MHHGFHTAGWGSGQDWGAIALQYGAGLGQIARRTYVRQHEDQIFCPNSQPRVLQPMENDTEFGFKSMFKTKGVLKS